MELLSPKTFAEALSVSPRLVREWCADGKVKSLTLGKGKRRTFRKIPKSELERVLREGLAK